MIEINSSPWQDQVNFRSEGEPSGRVLIAIDGREERDRIANMLSEGGLVIGVANASSMDQVEKLARFGGIDVALVGAVLGNRSGLDVVNLLHHAHSGWAASAILVTDRADAGEAIEALRLGFSDYLVRTALTPEILVKAVGTALRNAELTRAICGDQDALRAIDRIQRLMCEPGNNGNAPDPQGASGTVLQPATADGDNRWASADHGQLGDVAAIARRFQRIRPNRPH